MTKGVLIVEGKSDYFFFKKLCKKNGFNEIEIEVYTPDNFNDRETKQGVINILQILIKLVVAFYVDRLGIIVDADYVENGGGLDNTLSQIYEKIKDHGYSKEYKKFENTGIYFESDKGLPKIGVWVMPNNLDEGMIEDWILSICNPIEQPFLDMVVQKVEGVKPIKFKEIHKSKAISSTWLAWQKKPGLGFFYLFKENLIDEQHTNYKNWIDWMNKIFIEK